MSGSLLSSGDMIEVTGISHDDLNQWCRRGLLTPAEGGSGLGNHRRFTVLQAIAVAYAVQWRRHVGAHYGWVEGAMKAIQAMREDTLRKAVAGGRPIGWASPKGKFLLLEAPGGFPLSEFPWMDMAGLIRAVDSRIEAVERRLRGRGPGTGRRRGLAGASMKD